MNEADVLRVIISLVFILMVILAGAWAVRRSGFGRSGATQALRTVATQNLGNRAWVTIVEVEDARLVLGVTAQQITLLHTLPPGEATPGADARPGSAGASTGDSTPAGFTAALGRALKRR